MLGVIGFTYSYFSLEIEGNSKEVTVTTGNLKLQYIDNTELNLIDAVPGDYITKEILVKNIGTKSVSYNLKLNDLINTIDDFELSITLTCESYNSNNELKGKCPDIYRTIGYSETKTSKTLKKNIEIDVGITHKYTVVIKFVNKDYSQDSNLNKKFSSVLSLEEYEVPKTVNCTYDGEMVQGTKFVKGQYTYSYKQEGDYAGINTINWKNIDEDGWGVQLSSKVSTDPVSGEICSYINGKPIVSMNDAYYLSQATSIDITGIDTRNVTNMHGMFYDSKATVITGLETIDTSKVTNMRSMFINSKASKLNLETFDTSKVTNMGNMFAGVNLTEPLNLSNFDTSNVTDMSSMFYLSAMKKMDISNFNTKNVTSMNGMFQSTTIDKLDLRNFDISNVTASNRMLGDTKINILNLSNLIISDDTVLVDIFANSTIKEIIVNNEETLNILKSTSNIPSNMKFTLKTS
ncbi:MAG: BspA family leucine-rich repeat surface protein [Bacilli bacterium]